MSEPESVCSNTIRAPPLHSAPWPMQSHCPLFALSPLLHPLLSRRRRIVLPRTCGRLGLCFHPANTSSCLKQVSTSVSYTADSNEVRNPAYLPRRQPKRHRRHYLRLLCLTYSEWSRQRETRSGAQYGRRCPTRAGITPVPLG
jgi:hypothetical protein